MTSPITRIFPRYNPEAVAHQPASVTINYQGNGSISITYGNNSNPPNIAINAIEQSAKVQSEAPQKGLAKREICPANELVKQAGKGLLPNANSKEWIVIALWLSGMVLGLGIAVFGIATLNPALKEVGTVIMTAWGPLGMKLLELASKYK